jgi:hypothetical protein
MKKTPDPFVFADLPSDHAPLVIDNPEPSVRRLWYSADADWMAPTIRVPGRMPHEK